MAAGRRATSQRFDYAGKMPQRPEMVAAWRISTPFCRLRLHQFILALKGQLCVYRYASHFSYLPEELAHLPLP